MKTTNVHNIPETFVRFRNNNAYSKGDADLSVTTLIDSPKVSMLRSKHAGDAEEDISEQIMSILGTAVHNVLESGAGDDDIVEQRLYVVQSGITWSGQIDLMEPIGDGWRLSDYKTCSAFAIKKNPDGKQEWAKQLNLYGLLAARNGYTVSSLEVVAIIRDWTRSLAERDPSYPQSAVLRIEIPMWSESEVMKYAAERISAHKSDRLSQCTPEEMWESKPVYAVHKNTKSGLRIRAHRVLDDEAEANDLALEVGQGAIVKRRPGKRARCEGNYCGVSEFCEQFSSYQRERNE